MWQNMADQYSRELAQGVAQQRQDQMQQAQLPLSLMDRFQAAYQRQKQQRLAEEEAKRQAEQQEWSRKRMEGIDAAGLEDKRRDDRRALYTLTQDFDAREPGAREFLEEEAARLGSKLDLPRVTGVDTTQELPGPTQSGKPLLAQVEDPLSGRGTRNRSAYETLMQKSRDAAEAKRLEGVAKREKWEAEESGKNTRAEEQRNLLKTLKSMGSQSGGPNLEFKATDKGFVAFNPKTGEATPVTDKSGNPIKPPAKAGAVTKGNRMGDPVKVANLLVDIDKYLDDSTGSWIGAGVDQVARAFGYGTEGAEAGGSLKTLAAQLIMAMPRLEGPQSDPDVKLYKEQAGNLGDTTVPVSVRKKALKTIRETYTRLLEAARVEGKSAGDDKPLPPTLPRADFDKLKPENKKRHLDAGGKVE